MQRSQIDNLFLVSSLGQLNNAIQLVKSSDREGEKNGCTILWTKANRLLADKLTDRAELFFDHVHRLCLPLNPTGGDPYTLYKCKKSYDLLFKKFSFKNAWVANSNTHYALFLAMCAQNNVIANYFEEGLGTYKPRTSILYPTSSRDNLTKLGLDTKKAFAMFCKELWLDKIYVATKYLIIWIYKKVMAPLTLAMKVTRAAAKYICSTRPFKDNAVKALPAPYSHYYGIHENFEKISVFYPEYIDKSAFKGRLEELPLLAENYLLNQEELDILDSLPPHLEACSCIYVSQKYSGETRKWALILCQTLKKQSIDHLFIKFHPKESIQEREITKNILLANNISIIDIDPANQLDALKLISCLGFEKVYGLTSSVLFYGKKLAPKSEFISLAPLFSAVGRSKNLCTGSIEKMMVDYTLLSAVAPQIKSPQP